MTTPSEYVKIRIKFNDTVTLEQRQAVFETIVALGSEPESGLPGLMSVDVPADDEMVMAFLEGGVEADLLTFETGDEKVLN